MVLVAQRPCWHRGSICMKAVPAQMTVLAQKAIPGKGVLYKEIRGTSMVDSGGGTLSGRPTGCTRLTNWYQRQVVRQSVGPPASQSGTFCRHCWQDIRRHTRPSFRLSISSTHAGHDRRECKENQEQQPRALSAQKSASMITVRVILATADALIRYSRVVQMYIT